MIPLHRVILAGALVACSVPAEAGAPLRPASLRANPLILLVHGWAGDRRTWLPVRHRLHRPSLAIDLPGHGADRTDVSGWPISRFSEAVERARQSARSKCLVLVTHSNGSYVALDYWRRYPERVAAMVIVEGTFTRPFKDSGTFERQARKISADWASHAARPFGLEGAKPATAVLVRKVSADARPTTARATLEMLTEARLWEPVAITAPVTFALARSPAWTEEERQRLRKAAPRSEFVDLGSVSHYAQLDAPDAIARLIGKAAERARCRR